MVKTGAKKWKPSVSRVSTKLESFYLLLLREGDEVGKVFNQEQGEGGPVDCRSQVREQSVRREQGALVVNRISDCHHHAYPGGKSEQEW